MTQRVPGPGGLLAVRIGPADVGRRVTVRHRPDPAVPTLTDVVGVLQEWRGGRAGHLEVRRRDGRTERIRFDTVVAARVVAPEVSAEAMQRIAQTGWPATESARLGDWELRWAGGGSGRANSVRVCGSPGLPLDAALERVAGWYAARGGAARLQVPVPSLDDGDLDALGWPVVRRTRVLHTDTTGLVATASERARGLRAVVDPAPSPEWLALVGDRDTDDDDLLRRILTAPGQVGFAGVRSPTGELVGIGRVSLSDGWAGVTSVETVGSGRRRGVASAVMAALGAWAADRRAARVYLQVFATNAPALALYEQLGFTTHHEYVYRAAPGARAVASRDTAARDATGGDTIGG